MKDHSAGMVAGAAVMLLVRSYLLFLAWCVARQSG